MNSGESVTITLSKENYNAPSDMEKFVPVQWGYFLRMVVRIQKNNGTVTYTMVRTTRWAFIHWFQIMYYKIKYHEKKSARN